MRTPSERIFAQREDGDGTELRDFLPPRARHPMTLTHTADRIAGGVALREAVADFVDDLRWARDDDDVAQRITARPPPGSVPRSTYPTDVPATAQSDSAQSDSAQSERDDGASG